MNPEAVEQREPFKAIARTDSQLTFGPAARAAENASAMAEAAAKEAKTATIEVDLLDSSPDDQD